VSSETAVVEEYRLRGNLAVEIADRVLNLSRVAKLASLGILLVAPFVVGTFYIRLLTEALILVMFAIGVDLIWGYSGEMTFGHAAFFGFGAYLMGLSLLSTPVGQASAYLGIVLAVVLPTALGLVVAYTLFSIDMVPMNFTMITLAIAIMAEQLAISLRSITGGYDGLFGIPSLILGVPGAWFPVVDFNFYYLVVVLAVGLYLLAVRIVHSPFGTALVAIRENEERARALGYDTGRYKTLVFGIGCAFAGFAGALYAPFVGFVGPSSLGFSLSASVVLWILIGGRGTIIGAAVGTTFITIFQDTISSAFAFSWSLLLGISFVIIVLVFPEGFVGLTERIGTNQHTQNSTEKGAE
jgi:ABC-type branched-subunit amino acid transport system permease subunit